MARDIFDEKVSAIEHLPTHIDFGQLSETGREIVSGLSGKEIEILYAEYTANFAQMLGGPVDYDAWLANLPESFATEIRLRIVRESN